ncbi:MULTISPECIES: HNH endonuclease [unclassified Rhizobium]|uniref:HNH endonuclease n=1 Tax=unclassified Rhizobium TaxID=2613769 RepID=UPI000ABC56EE|nr:MULTISPECIES: HNH endonuclease [unclassified Rhizobium]
MIKLEPVAVPLELTVQVSTELTAEFKVDKSRRVWNKPYIKDALLRMSHSKCAYCETDVVRDSSYMEVEHFRCKTDHEDLVVEWSNLLPSCKRCNIAKADHNVDVDGMVINPAVDDPRQHLTMLQYRLHGRDDLGRRTIETIYLNDSSRVVRARFEVGDSVNQALSDLRVLLQEFIDGAQSPMRRNRIVRGLVKVLEEGAPPAEYSATAATAICANPDYRWIVDHLKELGLWSEDIQTADVRVAATSLL